jgi:hypothetical protein
MVERASTTLDQLASSWILRQLESPEEVNPQDGHLDFSLQKSPLEALARELQLRLPLAQALDRKASWPHSASARSRKAGRMRDDAESGPHVHQETPATNLVHHMDQDPWVDGVKPPQGL